MQQYIAWTLGLKSMPFGTIQFWPPNHVFGLGYELQQIAASCTETHASGTSRNACGHKALGPQTNIGIPAPNRYGLVRLSLRLGVTMVLRLGEFRIVR